MIDLHIGWTARTILGPPKTERIDFSDTWPISISCSDRTQYPISDWTLPQGTAKIWAGLGHAMI